MLVGVEVYIPEGIQVQIFLNISFSFVTNTGQEDTNLLDIETAKKLTGKVVALRAN